MNSTIQFWNKTSFLWKIKNQEPYILAGNYFLGEHSSGRDALLSERIKAIDKNLSRLDRNSIHYRKELQKRFLTFKEFEEMRTKKATSKEKLERAVCVSPALEYWNLLLKHPKILSSFTGDDEHDYQKLLSLCLPSLHSLFFAPKPVPFPVSALDRHCFLSGRTGSGKTEFMKAIAYQIQHQSQLKQHHSIILLDPHGDLSESLLGFRINLQKPERVWYIDPQLENGKIPCINPFWRRVTEPFMIDVMSQQFAKAFSELIPEAGMSLQMEALLKPCLSVLLERGGCGLSDLQVFMDDNQNAKWVELGKKSSFQVYRQFFETAFLSKKYAPTKLAIYTRLQHLQNNMMFYHMMNGQSNIDLKKGMQEGRIILFNLSKGKLGEDASRALGRFVSATILSIVFQRAFESEHSRKPCYLFIDEFHNFTTESGSIQTIFSEARKYKLRLIVGTQSVGQIPLSLKNSVLNNSAVKLAGINGLPALKELAGDFGVSYAAMQSLLPYEFYLKHDHFPAIKIKSPDFLIKQPKRYFCNKEELKKLKAYLLSESGIYRDIINVNPNLLQTQVQNQSQNQPNQSTLNLVHSPTLIPSKAKSTLENRTDETVNPASDSETTISPTPDSPTIENPETASQNSTESSGSIKPKFHL
ncbi:type IV secretion system DNA-binding domain-containing protein [Chryseobacterium sp. APV1]|uniref:Type IV secretion system DNA-binding domain-containing protein n=1 Tax=Chryseobacterium urinae TaxID=3058400 RepID=A0ABT8U4X8_9FLAO|nr:type IV secretion system DNA-binding domain-containing protein [Chryseobacterium sp. APV1]MDO3425496.1 type IV secretion system DNA-binding domain-containing protein [Chryseobacterium sp. APV1]